MTSDDSLGFSWVYEGDDAYADTLYGRAIITDVTSDILKRYSVGSRHYKARIELVSGKVVTFPHIFDSFGGAEGSIYLALQEHASAQRTDQELTDLLATLRSCEQILAPDRASAQFQHLQRIESIVRQYFNDRIDELDEPLELF